MVMATRLSAWRVVRTVRSPVMTPQGPATTWSSQTVGWGPSSAGLPDADDGVGHISARYRPVAGWCITRTIGRKEFSTAFLRHRYDTWTPEQIVRLAMTHQPTFAPDSKQWAYSDTNYVLAGMVIQKATGHPYAREIEQRILRPLHLDSTTLPGTRVRVPGPSGRAYSKLSGELAGPGEPNGVMYDVTELNPSLAGAAGEMISTTRDLNRFYQALLSGRLLKKRQMKEMFTAVSISGVQGVSYGLGLMKMTLSCGIEVWGHNGGIQGSISQTMATTDGGHVLSLNFNGDWNVHEQQVVRAEFCGA
ncbi:serine hydrolase domain-containing protein [Streptomyces xanthochromogenes]|uniref:serine hydrolase domain-containing protein n=1 Tax=Streptomyces xanthochromogenes TaxID=67384 RepID=UPI00344392EA